MAILRAVGKGMQFNFSVLLNRNTRGYDSSVHVNRLHVNKNFTCALRNAVTGARETQRIDFLVGG